MWIIRVRTIVIAALVGLLALFEVLPAAAEVLLNEWQPYGSVDFTNNQCDPGGGLIDLFGEYHRVVIRLPDGTIVTQLMQHLVGHDAAGHLYQDLTRIELRDPVGQTFSSVVQGRLISQGSTNNLLYTATYVVSPNSPGGAGIFNVTASCQG
jgi:hypothetical protein